MIETIKANFFESFNNNQIIKSMIPAIEKDVLSGKISSYRAAQQLLENYYKNLD